MRRSSQHTVRFVVRLELALYDADGCKEALAPFWLPLMFAAAEQPGEPTPLAHNASKHVQATLSGALHATIAAATQCRDECWSIHVQALTATAGPAGDGLGPLSNLLVLHADVVVRFSKRLHRCWADDDLRRAADTYGAAVSRRQTRARPSPLSEELATELQATGWPGLDVCAAYVGPVDLPSLPTASAAAENASPQTRGTSMLSCLQSEPVAQPVAPVWQPTAHNKSRSAARTSRASQSRLPSTPLYTSTLDNHAFSPAEDELAATIATAVQALVGGAVPDADIEHGGALSADDDNLRDARALRILRTALQGVAVEEQSEDEVPAALPPPWATTAARRLPAAPSSAAAVDVETAADTHVNAYTAQDND
jgi:hypothetical protein